MGFQVLLPKNIDNCQFVSSGPLLLANLGLNSGLTLTHLPVMRKILTGKVGFAQQMPTIFYSAFIFKKASVSIPTEFDSNWQSPFGFQMLFYSNSK